MNNSSAHTYEVNLQWNSDRKGTISSPVFPKGMKDIWSPEHLFIGSVNSCLMATFLAVAENSKFDFVSFECNAVGIVETVDRKLMVTQITLKPKVVIQSTEHEEQLKKILEMSERQCLISNSITTKILLEPIIIIK